MREIKFRAWYTPFKNKKFGTGYKYGNSVISFHDMSPDKYELEQYTGLKDKNGVEIYEGDIVQYGEDRDFIFVVIFKYGCFYAHNILGEKFMTDSLLGSLVMSEKVSVIGNIHENADLLVDDIGNDIHEFLQGGDK